MLEYLSKSWYRSYEAIKTSKTFRTYSAFLHHPQRTDRSFLVFPIKESSGSRNLLSYGVDTFIVEKMRDLCLN